MNTDKLYFRQLRAGIDFARDVQAAAQMQNFVYVIGDREKGEALIVDPAWGVGELVDEVEKDGLRLVGALVTHYHPDHIGGAMFGLQIQGLAELLSRAPCTVHTHRLELPGVQRVSGLSTNDLVGHESGDRVAAGDVEIELLHTPGHTPGSLCFRVDGRLISGDTLFLRGCGRVDLPGGNVDEMFRTLNDRLGSLSPDTVVYPGHDYGGASASFGDLRQTNAYLRVRDLMTWRQMFRR